MGSWGREERAEILVCQLDANVFEPHDERWKENKQPHMRRLSESEAVCGAECLGRIRLQCIDTQRVASWYRFAGECLRFWCCFGPMEMVAVSVFGMQRLEGHLDYKQIY